jgi:hypothetical protein
MFVLRYFHVWKNIEATRRMDIIKLKNTQQYDKFYGAITMTYFPINIILLPFFIPLVLMKSERLNNFILQLQYFMLVIMYCVIALCLALPISIVLYAKIVLNSLFIAYNGRKHESIIHMLVDVSSAILMGLPLIVVSLVVDLLTLNGHLMRDEKHFEFKYQQVNVLAGLDPVFVMNAFYFVFINGFEKNYKNKGKTEYQLMMQHTNIFQITNNFHSVFCRGDKEYEDAMGNIKVFNLTKILGNKCSIPSKMGIKRLDYLDFNILNHLFDETIMFNYFYFC